MTKQNATETKSPRRQSEHSPQENRSGRNRRRRRPDTGPQKNIFAEYAQGVNRVKEDPQTAQTPVSQHKTGQNAPQSQTEPDGEPRTTLPKDATQVNESQGTTGNNKTVQTKTAAAMANPAAVQNVAPQTDVSQDKTADSVAAPTAEAETAITEAIDYEETYQAIYRDILENLRSFSPSDQVACSITPEHIAEYLENSHKERVLQFKERREKRFFAALELIAVLAAVVLVIHYLQNNSAILVNILYIIAGLGALFLWKFQPKNDDKPNSHSGREER